MPLADSTTFTREHIEAHRFNAPTLLAEQAVHCLELVAELSSLGLDFKFKGGNSLLVLLDEPRRFSIDVDIATAETREKVEETVKAIIEKYDVFLRYDKREHKTKPWLPMVSFHLYYKSQFDASGEHNIMFDVILKPSPYPGQQLPVVCGKLYASTQEADLPTISGLVGDKILTLGPNTLGIPLGKNKEGQRLKHGNDIYKLLDKEPAISEIRTSVKGCLIQENELQKIPRTMEEVYQDTMDMCRLSAAHLTQPAPKHETTVLDELTRGIEPLGEHLFAKSYSWQELQLDLGRVALCFAAVVTESVSDSEFLSVLKASSNLSGVSVGKDLQALADVNLEAAFYWDCVGKWTGV